ncbi:hypothetical protein D9757_006263 [Collybiopsis confluens]|uniref:SH3 domain-containing protein n=1 Tax=Collybiopsis confluens TaxID=2823264 RepID=A0A8H5HK00_9AGAR|nr:hypothetical protein D9757_006263 [Collybiopsis confluens]
MKLNSPLPQSLPKECLKAAKIFQSFVDSGNNGLDGVIPRHVLENAKGFAIFTIFKAGFLFSARAGSGIVIAKLSDGTWSAPSAIGTAGLGVGGQLGAEMTDFLVVLNSRSAIRSFMAAGSLTLGGNASIAVGPLGRNGEASGSLNTSGKVAAMYSYSKTRGLFGGISIEGSVIVERQDANVQAYGNDSVTAKLILAGNVSPPPWATPLIKTLEACTGMPGTRAWINDSRDAGYSFGGMASPGAELPSSKKPRRPSYPPASWGEPKSAGSYFNTAPDNDSQSSLHYGTGAGTGSSSTRPMSMSVPRSDFSDGRVTSTFDTPFKSDYVTEGTLSKKANRMSSYTPSREPSAGDDPFGFGDFSSPSYASPGHGRSVSVASPFSSRATGRQNSLSLNPFSTSAPSSDSITSGMGSMSISSPISKSFTSGQPYIAPKPELRKPLVGIARAIALYNFEGVELGDLSLKKGDVITITQKSDSSEDWWTGTIDDRKGIFPANFVEVVYNSHLNIDVRNFMSGIFNPPLPITSPLDFFYDPRTHGYQGPSRTARLPRACVNGGGSISKSPDGTRCVVAGKESLKIIRVKDVLENNVPEEEDTTQYKNSVVGKGGSRIEASRNLWEVSGLKIECTPTSAAWCRQEYKNKILTSARNGELIMWDINKTGSKYERKSKDHSRSIHALSISPVVSNYCITGSSDGDLRDLREFQKSIMRAAVGLDNGSIYRWDLKMGQRGALDRIPVAHSASVTSLDWCSTSTATSAFGPPTMESVGNGCGWIVSGGLDRCVKVWDLTSVTSSKSSHIPHKPTYTLHPSFQVRRVHWRPSHECEIAIISNGAFASGSNADINNSASVSALHSSVTAIARTPSMRSVHGQSSVLSKIGTGLGLGLDLLGGKDQYGESRNDKKGDVTPTGSSKTSSDHVGDAAEIWDVRRSWIAKWSVQGSAVQGGCTDIAFGDQHTLWAQHGSGAFSQLDLREAIKPIDAIPRVALASEASGSLTFVAGSANRWEIPYDDVRPEAVKQAGRIGVRRKTIGDPAFQNTSQTVGTFTGLESDDLQTFIQLARSYVIEGGDRLHICTTNAQLAFEVGHFEAAQVWSLVATSLADIVPDTPPSHSLPSRNNMPHSSSAPAMLSYSFPPERTSSGGGSGRGSDKAASIYGSQTYPRSLSTSGRKRLTPASSNNTSPRHGLAPLPPLTPITTARPPSYFGRRQSVDSNMGTPPLLPRRPSVYRRPSALHSASPSSSLKHVGEGALDDSDSESSSESGANPEQTDGLFENEEPGVHKSHISPAIAATRTSHPSPLSRLVGQHQWTETEPREEDDDDEASPSPRSTDSETSDGGSRTLARSGTYPNRRSLRRNSTSMSVKRVAKPRSQSATLHTHPSSISKSGSHLSVSSYQKSPLVRQTSQSSMLTVTAGEASYRSDQNVFLALRGEETVQDIRQQTRDKSLVPSEPRKGQADHSKDIVWTWRHGDIVQKEEDKMRSIAWAAAQQKLEDMADDGDVQTCAMLAILVPGELSIGKRRQTMLIEAYVDRLNRLQLFTCASYIRKSVTVEEVRNTSLVETIIYTSCGRCKKAFVSTGNSSAVHGDYSFCANCRTRLPVRGLIFQCSVCGHGGHQLCYRRYYRSRSMVDVPSVHNDHTSQSNQVRGGSEISRSTTSNASIVSTDDESVGTGASTSAQDTASDGDPSEPTSTAKLMGHPCVFPLCGHYCWIASLEEENHLAQA